MNACFHRPVPAKPIKQASIQAALLAFATMGIHKTPQLELAPAA